MRIALNFLEEKIAR